MLVGKGHLTTFLQQRPELRKLWRRQNDLAQSASVDRRFADDLLQNLRGCGLGRLRLRHLDCPAERHEQQQQTSFYRCEITPDKSAMLSRVTADFAKTGYRCKHER